MRLRRLLAGAIVVVVGCSGSSGDSDPAGEYLTAGPAGSNAPGGVPPRGAEAAAPDADVIVGAEPEGGARTGAEGGASTGTDAGVDADADAGGSSSGDGGVIPGADGGGNTNGSLCSSAAQDPTAATTISSYIDKLSGVTKPTGAARARIVEAIIKTCHVFSPPSAASTTGWQRRHCWAHLVSAIAKESSYNAGSTVNDTYATRMIGAVHANDPTVGLVQIRFSSAVRQFAIEGRLDHLACVGCTLPAALHAHDAEPGDSSYWAVTGPTQNLSLMKTVECNLGIGAWYYYVNATGNGKASAATHVPAYCTGQGTAANLVTGLRSYVNGPDLGKGIIPDINGVNALQTTDANVHAYITAIKASFDSMIPATSGKHPFFLTLSPNASQYCR